MSEFTDHELLTTSATVSILSVVFGGLSRFSGPEPGHSLAYILMGVGVLLLLATLAAWRNRRALAPLRYLLGLMLGVMLVGALLGYDPTAQLRPHGRFVSLVEAQQSRV